MREIAAAARAVFTQQGFRLTQVADIARQAGISAGAVYSYVDGKDALLELAMAEAMGEVSGEAQSFDARGISGAGAALAASLRKVTDWPVLQAAVGNRAVPPPVLAAIVAELFELVERRRHLIWLLDRCARDIPELNGLYESAVRGRLINDFCTAIAIADGVPATSEETEAKARALFEMIAWMGMHRQRDRQPPPIGDRAALDAAVVIVERSVGTRASGRQAPAERRKAR